jgi:superfamily II DNA or RNA helicase
MASPETMTFSDLLVRVDTDVLQQILGGGVVGLLQALNPELARPPALRRTLAELNTPSGLLLDRDTRQLLLELLKPDEAGSLCEHLGIKPHPTSFEALANYTPRAGSQSAVLLLSFFGLTLPERPDPEPAPPTTVSGGYELFDHQRTAVRAAVKAVRSHPHRVLIHMPTGSGKTRTAISLLCDHLRQAEPAFVLWLAASEELCEQAAAEFSNAWSLLGNRKLPLLRWWGSEPLNAEIPVDGIAIGGLAKVYTRGVNELPWWAKLGDRTSLMVFDEAHQAIAPTYRHVVETLIARSPNLHLIGLSATPGRTWNDIDADKELAAFFGQKKVTLTVPGFDNPVDYLIDEGYLARPAFRSIEHQGTALTEGDRNRLASSLDIPRDLLQRIADDYLRNLAIAKEVRDLARRHKRILVFSATVEHAEVLAVVLRAIGVDTRAVTASTPTLQRSQAISWYRQASPEPRVLSNFGVLTTGFDAPKTSAALIARPTKSLVLYSQMVGRAIRGPRAGGNRDAEIVTVVDTTLPGFRSLTEAFSNWEDVWHQDVQ